MFDNRMATKASYARSVLCTLLMAGMTASVGIGAVHAQADLRNPQAGDNQAQNEIKLNLQDVDIRVLINTVAEVSGKNFIVDPRVKGKVSVISGKSVSPQELYDYFLAILEVHNFATVGSGNVIKVLPSNVIKQKPTTTLFKPTTQENDEQVTQIIQLQHASVQDLVAIIRPLIPPTSHFAPHTPSNSVILTDTAANIQRVLKIIRRIDIPDKRSNTHVVYLEKTKASDMANTLTQLVASSADPKDAAAGAKLSIQAFDAINALVISATDEQFARVKALVDELDVERELDGDVNVIPLKYAKAEDLVSILNDVTASATQGAAADFNVQADEASNSLVVKASAGQLKTVQSVVDRLDKRRAQVYVESIIAEVSLSQVESLGIQFGAGVTPPAVGGTGDTPGIIDFQQGRIGGRGGTGTGNSSFGLTRDGGRGFNYNVFDFGKYQLDVILNALRTDTDTNVLSTPTVLTLDNEEAELIVGQEVPFVTGRFNNGFNDTPVDGGDGNNGGNNGRVGTGFQTIERRDVGIVLRIKPQINEGDTINLEVFQETSSVVGATATSPNGPTTNRRSIEGVVQVDDGQVVVLGGLITDDLSDARDSVPFLGKIPLLGALFRSKTKRATKRNLMVFLKPRIVRSAEDLASYSKGRYDEIRRDGQIFAETTDDLLVLPDAEPPILIKYEDAVKGDSVSTEARERRAARGEIKKGTQRRIKDIIFGRRTPKPKAEHDTSSESAADADSASVAESAENSLQAAMEKENIELLIDEVQAKQRATEKPVLNLSSQPTSKAQPATQSPDTGQ